MKYCITQILRSGNVVSSFHSQLSFPPRINALPDDGVTVTPKQVGAVLM